MRLIKKILSRSIYTKSDKSEIESHIIYLKNSLVIESKVLSIQEEAMYLHQLERLSRVAPIRLSSACASVPLFASTIMAQPATFSDNVLNIPKATVGQKAYSLDLGLSVNGAQLRFWATRCIRNTV